MAACVLHTGYTNPQGYGHVWADGLVLLAHRAAWAAAHGPVPPQLVLHHVCENPACINVDHLVPVTRKQHAALHPRVGWKVQHPRTHCVSGHPFDAENTYTRPDGGRTCRACNRASVARYKKGRPA